MTLDALDRGTPVLTWSSKHLSARTTESILRHWGFGELVAPSREAFPALAISLIDDAGRRRSLRQRILSERRRFDEGYFRSVTRNVEEQLMDLRREN